MTRIAAAAVAIVIGWSVVTPVASADPQPSPPPVPHGDGPLPGPAAPGPAGPPPGPLTAGTAALGPAATGPAASAPAAPGPAAAPPAPAPAGEPPSREGEAPPPGPLSSFGDGTYTVGTDILPGVYQSAGPVEGGVCYWKRANGDGIVANAMSKKPQTVQIEAGDTTFKSSECQEWQKTDAPPPPPPSPADLLGQLGSLIGQSAIGPSAGTASSSTSSSGG